MKFDTSLNVEQKKAFLLLMSVIFHYHGLDEDEQRQLDETAQLIAGAEELTWANEFITSDYYTAFERAKDFLGETIGKYPKEVRLAYLSEVWHSTEKKGYISEMEATAMLKLARSWEVEGELVTLVRK
ncbi:MAG: hypothetical protein MUF77_00390 [Leptospira sp.]|jgi:hypothetical protein|nr:hypothetical protein [Leptospira sp.]